MLPTILVPGFQMAPSASMTEGSGNLPTYKLQTHEGVKTWP